MLEEWGLLTTLNIVAFTLKAIYKVSLFPFMCIDFKGVIKCIEEKLARCLSTIRNEIYD